ncbi:hypothetical protein BUE80_DR000806 [Diplocarpon rosae]|nr:hypothetical protein BUE80_DR000806 [Diplocarpon rosae]
MATPPAPSSSVAETLARLSTKSGVIATLAMDGKTATVLQSMGTVATMFASNAAPSHAFSATVPTPVHPSRELGGSAPAIPSPLSPEDQAFETFAKMVWNYVNATGQLVHDMDSEDEVKLLRLRTRKHELVIVPDSKYIFVVVHDVPSS